MNSSQNYEYRIGDRDNDHPILDAFIASRAPVSIIIGPLGSGKTYGALQRLLKQMCEQEPNAECVRPTRWLVIRNTYRDLLEITYKDFMSVFEGLGKSRMSSMESPTFHARFRLEDGTIVDSEVIFSALDRDDGVRKLRGAQITGGWLNEVKELYKPVVDMLDARRGRYPSIPSGGVMPTWNGILGDTNAPDEDHWLYRLSEEDRPEGWVFFRQPGGVMKRGDRWVENPRAENAKHLRPNYYRDTMQGKDEDWIKVNLANEYGFVVDGKPIHPEYQDSLHCSDLAEYVPRAPILLGMDFGRTPAAILAHYLQGPGRWVIFDELCSEDMSASLFGPALARMLERQYGDSLVRGWGDPAGDHSGQTIETTPIEIMQAAGIPLSPAPSNVFALRVAAVARGLSRIAMDGKPGLLIHPRCRRLRKALAGGYCYRRLKVSGERYSEQPDKNMYSHPAEALQYLMLGGGEGRQVLRKPWVDHARLPTHAYTGYE